MGIFQRLFGRSDNETREAPAPTSAQFVDGHVGQVWAGGSSDTGVSVDELTALASASVWTCIKILAETVGTLPLHVQDRNGGARRYDHPLYRLLAQQPNEYMTAPAYREQQMANLLLWGNCYAYIEEDAKGRPVALLPLESSVTRSLRVNDALVYTTTCGGKAYQLRPDQILHVHTFSLDGITGLSPILFARQSIGLSLGLEKFAAKFFGSGANAGGILSLPPMSPDAMTDFAARWRAEHAGMANAFKIACLPDGYKFTPTTTNPENAQALQARVHQTREVARIYRVPPHMLGDTEKASYASLEVQDTAFHTGTVSPYVVKFEAEYDRKLLLDIERPIIQCRYNLDASLRATTQQRYDAHAKGIGAGFLTINEARQKEGLPAVKGGDELLRPLNLGPVAANAKPDPAASQVNRSLIEDAGRRVLTKEVRSIQRAAKKYTGKPEEFRAWATTFYAAHEPLVVRSLTASMKAIGTSTTPADYAIRHCEESRTAAIEAFTAGSVDDLIDTWETLRPADIAEALTN